jgi:hypothetical protein
MFDILQRGARREDHGIDDFQTFLRPTKAFDKRERERKSSSW